MIVYEILGTESPTALAVCADPGKPEPVETQLLRGIFGHPEAYFGSTQEANTSHVEIKDDMDTAYVVSKGGCRELTLERRPWMAPGEEPERGSCDQTTIVMVDDGLWKVVYHRDSGTAGYGYFGSIDAALAAADRATEGRGLPNALLG